MRAHVIAAAAAALTIVLAACGDGSSTTVTTSATTATTAASASTTTASVAPAATGHVSVPVPTQDPSVLTAVRAAAQGGSDRVTFEFSGANPPGYDIGYTTEPIPQGEEGVTIPVSGDAVLLLHFAEAVAWDQGGAKAYTGPKRFTPPDTHAITEVVDANGGDGDLYWAVGTHSRIPFHVSTLTNPSRIVVDLGS